MAKSLADLRSERPQNRPERPLTVCLKPDLVAEVFALDEEKRNLRLGDLARGEGETARKMGEGAESAERIAQIDARLAELVDEMAEHEGELRLRANLTDGEWRRWVNEHPARPEDQPGHQRDQEVTAGYCNADDLIDALDLFAHSWNGDPLADGDWAILEPNIGGPDKKQAATAVVSMYEARLDFQLMRTSIFASLKKSSGSAQPATSESATNDSSAGSRRKSSAATTKKATESR